MPVDPGSLDLVSTYLERLRPSAPFWLLAPVAAVVATVSTVPFGAAVAVAAGVVVGLAVVALLLARVPELRVDAAGLRAGPAFLEAEHLGEIEALDAVATQRALGPQLRADAYVVHRPWVRTAVRVGVADEADPTPYWLVSSRRPEELARALLACREAAGREGGQAAHSEQTG